MRRVQALELEAAEAGDDAGADHVPVYLVGALADRAPHGVLQPPLQVLLDRQRAGVEDEPVVPIPIAFVSFWRTSSRSLPVM